MSILKINPNEQNILQLPEDGKAAAKKHVTEVEEAMSRINNAKNVIFNVIIIKAYQIRNFERSNLYISLMHFSKTLFWNSYYNTVINVCWFQKATLEKKLFQFGNALYIYLLFQPLS